VYIDESEVPPGKWRVGTSASDVKCRLFMRLATKGKHLLVSRLS